MPCLDDKTAATGFDRHYVYHTGWAARMIARARPELHIDISSSLYFCSMMSAFFKTQFYDYRPADLQLDNLESKQADLMSLPFESRSIKSISCLHVIEHIGLGRYGDPLDACGDRRAFKELQRVVAPGGQLLIVVPVGRPRICFNAHRIYGYGQVLKELPELKCLECALVPDDEAVPILQNPDPSIFDRQEYGCGCFLFVRPE